ncbi:MAG TPA: PsbP-related protein, partial [Gaiellaceae bacterium]
MKRFLLGAAVVIAAAGCGSGGKHATPPPTTKTTATTTTAATTSGAGALQAEANATAAGDIPDNQVFLVFHDARAGYSMKYPEGWAQQGAADSVVFRDKNNAIRAVVSAGAPWTRAEVQADVRALKGAHVQGSPQAITLSGRPAFKVVYRTVSAPSPVTGKRVTLTVDRYYVSKQGRRAVLDLGSPVGV